MACKILDATCPNVTRIHRIVSQAEERGRIPVIMGTPDHPEVQAIAGWCRHPVVLYGCGRLWDGGWRRIRNGSDCP